jgi:CRP/FNR family cyclic AMP-dependent transcriptional regulator
MQRHRDETMTRAEEGVALLAEVDLFQGLSKGELLKIFMLAREEKVRSGRTLAAEGEPGGGFSVIIEGRADVTVGDRAVNKLGPGDYFGEISLIDGEPKSATVTAASDMTLLSLAPFTFSPLLVEHPGITRKILLEMCTRLRAAEEAKGSRPASG